MKRGNDSTIEDHDGEGLPKGYSNVNAMQIEAVTKDNSMPPQGGCWSRLACGWKCYFCMSLLIIIGLTVAIILICLFLVSVGIGLGDLNYAALNYLNPDPKVMFSDILQTNSDQNNATGTFRVNLPQNWTNYVTADGAYGLTFAFSLINRYTYVDQKSQWRIDLKTDESTMLSVYPTANDQVTIQWFNSTQKTNFQQNYKFTTGSTWSDYLGEGQWNPEITNNTWSAVQLIHMKNNEGWQLRLFDNSVDVIRDTTDQSFKSKTATKDKLTQSGFDKQTWNGWESIPELSNSAPAYFSISTAQTGIMWLERIHLSYYGTNPDFSNSLKN